MQHAESIPAENWSTQSHILARRIEDFAALGSGYGECHTNHLTGERFSLGVLFDPRMPTVRTLIVKANGIRNISQPDIEVPVFTYYLEFPFGGNREAISVSFDLSFLSIEDEIKDQCDRSDFLESADPDEPDNLPEELVDGDDSRLRDHEEVEQVIVILARMAGINKKLDSKKLAAFSSVLKQAGIDENLSPDTESLLADVLRM